MAIKDWKKLGWNSSLSKGGMMWGNSKKGGMVFVSKSSYKNEWRFGGADGRGYLNEQEFKSKSQAIEEAKSYMRSH